MRFLIPIGHSAPAKVKVHPGSPRRPLTTVTHLRLGLRRGAGLWSTRAGRPRLGPSLQRDDHLVGMRHVKLLADELVDHIGVGMAWIEQCDAVAQHLAARIER